MYVVTTNCIVVNTIHKPVLPNIDCARCSVVYNTGFCPEWCESSGFSSSTNKSDYHQSTFGVELPRYSIVSGGQNSLSGGKIRLSGG